MKIGVRAHDFGRQELKSLAKSIKDSGFDCVQLAPTKAIEGINNFDDINERHINDIAGEFYKNNLEISVLGCYIEPSISDREKRLANVDIFRQNLSYAKLLGVGIVGTETTHLDINAPPEDREKAYLLLKDSVLRMVETAEKEGVCAGIEPVAEHTLNTPLLTRRLLDEVNSPKLKIIFDPVNLLLPATAESQDEIFTTFFELLGSEIAAVHIKDIVIENGEKTWRNIGRGIVNYKLIFNWLQKNKPNISLLREGVVKDSFQQDITAMKFFRDNSRIPSSQ